MFSKRVAEILVLLGVCSVEFVVAVQATSGLLFAHSLLDLAPLMVENLSDSDCESFLQEVADLADRFAVFWVLVMAAKDTFLKDSARLSGFCQARHAIRPAALVPKSLPQKRALPSAAPSISVGYSAQVPQSVAVSPLMEQELVLKQKWIVRLEAVAKAAGSAARFNDEDGDSVLSTERESS